MEKCKEVVLIYRKCVGKVDVKVWKCCGKSALISVEFAAESRGNLRASVSELWKSCWK